MHMPVVYSVHDPETGRFNFSTIFEPVRHHIQDSDYSLANLETRLAGSEMGYSGYPRFNCPADLAGEMKQIGLDMFLTANNHSMDKGVDGVINTIRNLEEAGLDYVGTYASEEDRNKPFVKNIHGINLGIINYTTSTNGLPVPADKPYLVNIYEPGAVLKEIKSLQEAGVDIIIACIHFGTEYSREPSDEQREIVKFLLDSGVDIVLGNHVHVVQPVLYRTVEFEGKTRTQFAAFSLGNFISNQRWRYSDSGLLVKLTVTKNQAGNCVEISDIELVPVWVDTYTEQGKACYRVLDVNQAIEDYENGNDRLLTENDYRRLKEIQQELNPDFLFSGTLPDAGGNLPN